MIISSKLTKLLSAFVAVDMIQSNINPTDEKAKCRMYLHALLAINNEEVENAVSQYITENASSKALGLLMTSKWRTLVRETRLLNAADVANLNKAVKDLLK